MTEEYIETELNTEGVMSLLAAFNGLADESKHSTLMVFLAFVCANGAQANNMKPEEIMDILHRDTVHTLKLNPIEKFVRESNENSPSNQE